MFGLPAKISSPNIVIQAIPWQDYPSWAADDLVDLPVKGKSVGPVAVVDGQVITGPPFKVWESGEGFNDIPFLVGTTEQEIDFRYLYLRKVNFLLPITC